METRGDGASDPSRSRPAIIRRSCDHCRSRKIACDRGLPCANCLSAGLDCKHSTVASRAVTPKQRVLISSQYEQKIDDIAKGIDGIKLLLRGLSAPLESKKAESDLASYHGRTDLARVLNESQSISLPDEDPQWDYSAQIIDLVKVVVENGGSRHVEDEESRVLSSLKSLLNTLQSRSSIPDLSSLNITATKQLTGSNMPPLDATVAVLRWAKDRESYAKMAWISRILPLEQFSDTCRKVYFAIDDYNEIDFIIANGYLSYVFSERFVVSGLEDYREHASACRRNLYDALSRLPLLLPPSLEVIAALTLGAFNAIENSKASMAWNFISAAANLCLTLGYHRDYPGRTHDNSLRAAQDRLFWTVYRLEKGQSLRLGRASNIQDTEVTLSFNQSEARPCRLARIQGQAYDQLYSPKGLTHTSDQQRGQMAIILAEQVRGIIRETRLEISASTDYPDGCEPDPLRVVYLKCELVCQCSLLTLILRAIPPTPSLLGGVSEDCVAVAREVLDIHQECMLGARSCENDPFLASKYMNWAIINIPFVPFNILFTRAIQFLDHTDLARLERFATSLRPDVTPPESSTHPSRLYELLCQAAKLYIDANTVLMPHQTTLDHSSSQFFMDHNFSRSDIELDPTSSKTYTSDNPQVSGLGDWYFSNQQLMNLLDNDIMF